MGGSHFDPVFIICIMCLHKIAEPIFQKEKMDDDSFEMISSQPDSAKPTYETVPEDRVYRFKFLGLLHAPKKVSYKLKTGCPLPYSTKSGGK